jgi:hypothetical protein
MTVHTNEFHGKIGKGHGFYVKTERGQQVGAYATPDHWSHDKDAGMVTLYSDRPQWTTLTPTEARDLADLLREMADKAQPA